VAVVVVVRAGIWVSGGLITNDFALAMWLTAAALLAFFMLLYFFGPEPQPRPQEDVPETQVELPPIASGLFPQVSDPNPMLVIPVQGEQRLRNFLAGGDTVHTFLHMDNDEVPELVAGGYLFAEREGRYHLIFQYNGAMYVQHNRLYLYFNDLVGEYRSCYGCAVKTLPNDEPIAEIRLVYEGGQVAERWVTTGIRTSDKVQIVDGLNPDEKVLVNGLLQVYDGAQVKISNTRTPY
jgi:hypothetical protein